MTKKKTVASISEAPADQPALNDGKHRTGRQRSPVASFWLVARQVAAATDEPSRPWPTAGDGRRGTSLRTSDLQHHITNWDISAEWMCSSMARWLQ